MKLISTILAAVMTFALAGQAAEARDHNGWRKGHQRVQVNQGLHRGWNKNNHGWNKNHRGWNNNHRKYQAWNNNKAWNSNNNRNRAWNKNNKAWNQNRGSFNGASGRPWDTRENRAQQALQIMNAQNQHRNPYLY